MSRNIQLFRLFVYGRERSIMDKKMIFKKSLCKKKPGIKLNITYEILSPGILTKNPINFSKSPIERWEEIINICAETISENGAD